MMRLVLQSLRQTGDLGRILGRMAERGDVILLHGALGAGKTTLARSIASGLDVPPECYVTSPSFSLMLEYPGRMPLYHIDCYRLRGEDDVEESGLMDYIVADGLTVVEWPDRLGGLVPAEHLDIRMDQAGEQARKVIVTPHGRRWLERMDALKAACGAASILVEN
ncbi:MAG: tRNA (adenosine(37)-N6)-threonylcarbamoyltransferase complex ATPase subunit type 1 TsaE [Desulfobulbaceae bacterium]|jgi:tRNA threonylcarbamoyladenosine biosynthesis protein TsaE|nr:tRNA (adenosine(37)-N6)-threonylcarbamoyltransferase complex ATPase subunit type 1 TsaE [Desulfobulbaceae bacterium]MDY0350537.1 tRNA (adenosine(37)-N6)-threonylcarbamoyltransferase complex ATPase subunit type 1 TsaE [Desulfobulbaceae bacterium]